MRECVKVYICAGEMSGDRLGAYFMNEFSRYSTAYAHSIRWMGMGGKDMQASAPGSLRDMAAVQAAGFAELLPKAPGIVSAYLAQHRVIRRERPDLAVLVDYPDFNLRLARSLHRMRIPILYYGAPQCWAWRSSRTEKLKKMVSRLAVLFPFEEKWFVDRGVNAVFVGHPLAMEEKPMPTLRDEKTEFGQERETAFNSVPFEIGIFPGSRAHEVESILPVQLKAAEKLRVFSVKPFRFSIVAASGRRMQIDRIQQRAGIRLPYSSMDDRCDLAWCAAGTVTLELALLGIPWILTHRLNRVSHLMVKRSIGVDHLGMPNILLGRRVAPELVQNKLTAGGLARTTLDLLADGEHMQRIRESWQGLGGLLKGRGELVSVGKLGLDLLRK